MASFIASICAWTCCSAVGSIFNSCLGNDKPSTQAPSSTSGRKRSVFLLLISVGMALAFQYGLAPQLVLNSDAISNLPRVGEYIVNSWNGGCENLETEALRTNCVGNSGVFRVATVTFLFYLFAALAAYCKPTSNREAWPSKIFLYLTGVIATIFIPNKPLFVDIFLQVGRIGGAFFIVIQQLVFLDLSFNLNESWVRRADEADAVNPGSGKKWLISILVLSAVLFIGSLVVIVLLFTFYSGCSSNEAFISMTLIFSILITSIQLSGEESSLLTSAIITAYGTYLAFVVVSKNPNVECNPYLRERNLLGVILGVLVMIISITWLGWSNTTNKVFLSESSLIENEHGDGGDKVKGIVITSDEENNDNSNILSEGGGHLNTNDERLSDSSNIWKMNIVLVLLTCWFSMVLTGWGSIQGGGNLANPDVYNVSMWMIATSQWIMFALYLWSLVAPKLFPDRDFS